MLLSEWGGPPCATHRLRRRVSLCYDIKAGEVVTICLPLGTPERQWTQVRPLRSNLARLQGLRSGSARNNLTRALPRSIANNLMLQSLLVRKSHSKAEEGLGHHTALVWRCWGAFRCNRRSWMNSSICCPSLCDSRRRRARDAGAPRLLRQTLAGRRLAVRAPGSSCAHSRQQFERTASRASSTAQEAALASHPSRSQCGAKTRTPPR